MAGCTWNHNVENVEDFVMENSKFVSGKVVFRFILTGWVVVGGRLKRQKIAVLGGELAPHTLQMVS